MKLTTVTFLSLINMNSAAYIDETEIVTDFKKNRQHVDDSNTLLAYVGLLVLTMITMWVFKKKRIWFLHESGLSVMFGLLVGAILRYAGHNNHITADIKSLELHRDFLIKHYAGDVVYNITGFIDKNRDTLFQDFKRLLFNSSNEIYKSMWPEGAHDITATTKRPMTAGTIFKNSMSALMGILGSKEPFYVRCIKPNEIKSPASINDHRVIHQISYLGLMENVRVRRAGFAFRQEYK